MIFCSRHSNVMRVMPSPTIPRELMFKALDILGNGLKHKTHRRQRMCYDDQLSRGVEQPGSSLGS